MAAAQIHWLRGSGFGIASLALPAVAEKQRSPAGDWVGDGTDWHMAISADGRARFDGQKWSPSGPPPGPMPPPPSPAPAPDPARAQVAPAAPSVMETVFAIPQIYLGHLAMFLVVSAVAVVPLGLVLLLSDVGFGVSELLGRATVATGSNPTIDPQALIPRVVGMLAVCLVATVFLFPVGLGALIAAAGSAVAHQPISVGECYRVAIKHYPSLLGVVAIVAGVPIIWVSLCVAVAVLADSPVIVVALLPIFIAVRLVFVAQASVIDDVGPLRAMSRAWRVTAGRVRFLPAIIVALGLVVAVPVLVVAGLPAGAGIDLATELHLGEALGALAGVVMAPIAAIGTTVVYVRWLTYPPRAGSW